MSYRFIEELTLADVAFEADGSTLEELFASAGLALNATQVGNIGEIQHKESRPFDLTFKAVDMLLFNFLQDIIYWKDVDQILFGSFDLSIQKEEGAYHLTGAGRGERIDPARHHLLVDVKAVTMHKFEVTGGLNGWKATVVLDI
ncbi:MAG TPA: archease [Candidatus Manganitrophaceae bacterium]